MKTVGAAAASLFPLAASIALLSAGCAQNGPYTLRYKTGDCRDGESVTLYTFGAGTGDVKTIATSTVLNGEAIFEGHTDSTAVCGITKDGIRTVFILEPGEITIDAKTQKANGSPLNSEWNRFRVFADSLNADAERRYDIAVKSGRNREETQERLHEIIADYNNSLLSEAEKVIGAHRNDALGRLVFWTDVAMNNVVSPQRYKDFLSFAGPAIASFPPVKSVTDRYRALEETCEGSAYKNFTVRDGRIDGGDASLSDYVGEGRLLLVHFWAPHHKQSAAWALRIAEARKKLGNQLRVLSVAVKGEPEEAIKVIKAAGMDWEHIVSAGNTPAALYGVGELPHLMLIGADGRITARGVNPDDIVNAAAKILTGGE